MTDLVQQIYKATEEELQDIWTAVRMRYGEVFPDWEITMISVEKIGDRNGQIDRMIKNLESMKEEA